MKIKTPASIWSAYLCWFLATVATVIVLAGAFNVFVDPLGVFGSPRIRGLNAIKPYLDHHRELARWRSAQRLCADAGIFGNSRAEIGFDPENPNFSKAELLAFNHAIPGSAGMTVYHQLTWLKHIDCMPKVIFLGVEFFDFLGGSQALPQSVFEPIAPPHLDGTFFAESVFSIAGLRDAIETMRVQRTNHPAMLTERGFNPLYNYIDEVEQSGHYALFRQRADENARIWQKKAHQLRPMNGAMSSDEQTLEAILSVASASGSATYLIIYPYHAQIRLMMERLGLGKLFSEWKKMLVKNTARYSKNGGTLEIWDFSGISPETTETVPSRGDRQTKLKHYWEAGHFKKELGDLVIARMLRQEGSFGIKIDENNIDRWLVEDDARVKAQLAKPSLMLDEVDNVLAISRQQKR